MSCAPRSRQAGTTPGFAGRLRLECAIESTRPVGRSLEREHPLPIAFHVDDRPALRIGLIERFVEPPDRRFPIVGPPACGIGVRDEANEALPAPRRRPLEHLLIAVGVAEGEDRTPADEPVDADRLTRLVVDEVDLRKADELRLV